MVSPVLAQLAQSLPAKPLTADEVLSPYIFVFYVAFAVTFLLTPVMRTVARAPWRWCGRRYLQFSTPPGSANKLQRALHACSGQSVTFRPLIAGR